MPQKYSMPHSHNTSQTLKRQWRSLFTDESLLYWPMRNDFLLIHLLLGCVLCLIQLNIFLGQKKQYDQDKTLPFKQARLFLPLYPTASPNIPQHTHVQLRDSLSLLGSTPVKIILNISISLDTFKMIVQQEMNLYISK